MLYLPWVKASDNSLREQVLSSRRANLALGLILLMALGLRLWGLGFGLPYTYHVDEGALVMPALNILQTGDFNPHRFDYGSVHIYLLAGVYILYFLYGARMNLFQTVQDLPVIQDYHSITAYPFPTVFLAGRLLSALLGVLTVYWLYRVTARVSDRRVALIAAGLLAVMPAAVKQSHYIVSDTSMNVLLLMALEVILLAYWRRRYAYFAAAGLLTGLAASAKQSAVQMSAALILAASGCALSWSQRVSAVVIGLLGVIVGFIAGTPFSIIDLPTFLNWQAYDLRLYARLGTEFYEGPSWLWHWRYLLTGENALLFTISIGGAILMVWRKRWLGLILVSFPILHWFSMSQQGVRYDRTWLPMAPFVCMFGAFAIVAAADALSVHHRTLSRHSQPVVLALATIFVLPFLLGSMWIDMQLNSTDVRTRALEWIEQNLPSNAHLAVDLFGPPLASERWQLTRTVSLSEHPLEWYQSAGVKYLVLSEVMRTNPNRTVAEEERFQIMQRNCQPLAIIAGSLVGPPDRRMWIYDLNSCQIPGG